MATKSLLKLAAGTAPLVLGFLLSRGPLACAQTAGAPLPAVIFNEIHYHPPGDSGGEFLELYNRTDGELDLHGWEFKGAVRFRFDRAKGPAAISAKGFLVIARDPQLVARDTGLPPERVAGPYSGRLSNHRDQVALIDRGGTAVESIEYEHDGAWPARADGLGPSLQRISSEAPGNLPQNWTVALDRNPREGITPGRANSVTGPLPPLVRFVERSPEEPRPSQPVTIRVRVDGEDVESVELLYDLGEGEKGLRMRSDGQSPDRTPAGGIFAVELPPAPDGAVVRFRVVARSRSGALGRFPREGNPCPHAGYHVLQSAPQPNADLQVFHLLWRGNLHCAEGRWNDSAVFVHRGTAYLDIGLKYRGETSCSMPKPGMKIRFNRGALFEGQRKLNLLAGWQDRSLLREKLAWDLFRDIGHPHSSAAPTAVYTWGGAFHGLYIALEEPGEAYLRRNGLDPGSSLWKCRDSLHRDEGSGHATFDLLAGREDAESGRALADFARKLHAFEGKEHLEFVLREIDVESFIDYQAAKCLISDEDGYWKNWILFHGGRQGDDGAGKFWSVHPWDLDLSFGQTRLHDERIYTEKHPLMGTMDHARHSGWNAVIEAVFGRKCRDYFIKALYGRIWRLVEEKFNPDVLGAKVARTRAHTGEAARADLERWPRWGIEPRNPDRHRGVLEDYVARRSRFLRNFLLEENRTTAIEDAAGPGDGFRRFRYVPAPRMKIAAIHFRPEGGEDLEAIEVRNFEKRAVPIAGWNIPAVGYVFPEGSEAPADASFIVARRPEAWTRAAAKQGRPSGERVFGPFSGDLADDGEELRLRDGGLHEGKKYFPETVDSVKYRAVHPWPASESPPGASGKTGRIRLRSLSLDNDLPESWEAAP